MFHHSKIIAMFATLNNIYYSMDAGRKLASAVQAFFMPGHKVYLIWYPCTPVWSVNAPTASVEYVLSSGKGTDTFFIKPIVICLTTNSTLLRPQCLATSERPPTTRASLPSPSRVIPSPTLRPLAWTFTAAPSATCVRPTPTATPLPGASTSPGVKSQPAPAPTRASYASLRRCTRSAAAMWPSAAVVSASAILPRGCLAIRSSRSITATSPSGRPPARAACRRIAGSAVRGGLCRVRAFIHAAAGVPEVYHQY